MTSDEFVELRETEALAALARLGVGREGVDFLGFRDGALADQRAELERVLGPLLRDRAPDQVMVTSSMDRHPDHAVLGQVARLLAERGDIHGELYEYAIWQRMPAVSTARAAVRSVAGRRHGQDEGRWASMARQRPRIVRTGPFLQAKREAVAEYASQLPHFPVGFVDDFLQPFEVFTPVPMRRRAT